MSKCFFYKHGCISLFNMIWSILNEFLGFVWIQFLRICYLLWLGCSENGYHEWWTLYLSLLLQSVLLFAFPTLKQNTMIRSYYCDIKKKPIHIFFKNDIFFVTLRLFWTLFSLLDCYSIHSLGNIINWNVKDEVVWEL